MNCYRVTVLVDRPGLSMRTVAPIVSAADDAAARDRGLGVAKYLWADDAFYLSVEAVDLLHAAEDHRWEEEAVREARMK